MSVKKLFLAASLMAASSLALAGPNRSNDYLDHELRFDYAKVVDVRPIYHRVKTIEPVKECWHEPVTHYGRQHSHSAGGMLAGGIVGGIIGHHLGQGRKHRGIATAVGTLVGAKIGHEAVKKPSSTGHSQTVSYREHCSHTERVTYQEEITAYDVTYRYKGHQYQVELPYDPGKRIKMRVSATPVF